jgi:hypothetical protein
MASTEEATHDVAQIRQRGEAPLRPVQAEQEIDDPRIDGECRNDRDQLVEPRFEPRRFEADVEAHHDRRRGREQIVRHDQHLARRERKADHGSPIAAFTLGRHW